MFRVAYTVQESWKSRCPPPEELISSRMSLGFPGGSDGKESACSVGDPGSIPGSGRSPGEGNGNPTPIFSPGTSRGQRSLVDYSPWGHDWATNALTSLILYTEKKLGYRPAWGTSLAVQWLRLWASTAGGMGLIPGLGAKILLAMWPKKEIMT